MRKPQVGGGLRSGTGALQQFSAAGCLDSRYRPCQPPRRRAALGPCCGSVAARRRRRCAWAVGALLGAGSARCKARTKTLSAEGSENASFAARWPSCAALGQLRFLFSPRPRVLQWNRYYLLMPVQRGTVAGAQRMGNIRVVVHAWVARGSPPSSQRTQSILAADNPCE